MTYGDGLSNVNLKKILKFHKKNKNLATLTAVRPSARFGAIKLKGRYVSYFKEKSKLDEGWINGGFFVMQSQFLKFIKNDNTYLEREPLEMATKRGQLGAFRHKGFWQCVDTKRDKDKLNKIINSKKIKFLIPKKKILIVGGTGFIGYHLAKKSLKRGWDVTSISSNFQKGNGMS